MKCTLKDLELELKVLEDLVPEVGQEFDNNSKEELKLKLEASLARIKNIVEGLAEELDILVQGE